MSVYTPISRSQLEAFLHDYKVGKLRSYEGIQQGVENTNYFVDTERGSYVLTLFETVDPKELPYCLELTAYLADKDLPCARPVKDRNENRLGHLCGRPAVLVERLDGHSIETPGVEHCRSVGRILARLHLAGAGFHQHRPPSRGPAWQKRVAQKLKPKLAPEERELLQDELAFQAKEPLDRLPGGVIHSDLFRDNVLFQKNQENSQTIQLSGVIDFYYACNGHYIYDLAVTVNDWCPYHPRHTQALLQAYHAERPQEATEASAWLIALRAAALRFWLSRLHDRHFPRTGALTNIKDPEVFKDLLRHRRTEETQSPPKKEATS